MDLLCQTYNITVKKANIVAAPTVSVYCYLYFTFTIFIGIMIKRFSQSYSPWYVQWFKSCKHNSSFIFLYSNIHENFRIISSEEDHIALEFWTFFTRIAALDNYLVTEFLSIFLCFFCETFNIIVLLSLPEADHIFGPGSYIFAEWKPLISYVRKISQLQLLLQFQSIFGKFWGCSYTLWIL